MSQGNHLCYRGLRPLLKTLWKWGLTLKENFWLGQIRTKFSYGMIQFVPDGRIAACSFGVLSYEPYGQDDKSLERWFDFYLHCMTLSLSHMYSLTSKVFPQGKILPSPDCCDV